MHKLLQADKYLFSLINGKWHNNFLDGFMPYLRQSEIWIPLYIFLLVFVLMNVKKSGWFILFFLCSVALTDIISSHFIKNFIFRIRPCAEPSLIGFVRFLVPYCPQSSSFTSSHAANHFGMAVFVSLALRNLVGPWIYLSFLWALIIAYAQVYVGVHYPLDIFGGAIVGLAIGMVMGNIYSIKARNLILVNK